MNPRRPPLAERLRSQAAPRPAHVLEAVPAPKPIEAAILRHLQQVHRRAVEKRPVVATDVQGATDLQVGFEIERLRLLIRDSRQEWRLSLAGWDFVEQLRVRYPAFVARHAPDLERPDSTAS